MKLNAVRNTNTMAKHKGLSGGGFNINNKKYLNLTFSLNWYGQFISIVRPSTKMIEFFGKRGDQYRKRQSILRALSPSFIVVSEKMQKKLKASIVENYGRKFSVKTNEKRPRILFLLFSCCKILKRSIFFSYVSWLLIYIYIYIYIYIIFRFFLLLKRIKWPFFFIGSEILST